MSPILQGGGGALVLLFGLLTLLVQLAIIVWIYPTPNSGATSPHFCGRSSPFSHRFWGSCCTSSSAADRQPLT